MVVFLWSCAAQAPPPGGPPDESPPELVSTIPHDGAVLQKGISKIEFHFTEVIDPRSVSAGVRIFPRPEKKPDIDVKRKKVVVKLKTELLPATTYIVSLGKSVSDLRGNKVPREIVCSFSTGEKIDRGKIVGRVFGKESNKMEYEVFLYRLKGVFPDSIVFKEPDYRAFVDDDGIFRFSNLPTGIFRVLGFAHLPGRDIFMGGKGILGFPFRDPVVVNSMSEEPAEVSLLYREYDLTRPVIGNVFLNNQGYLEFVMNKELSQEQIDSLTITVSEGSISHLWINSPIQSSFYAKLSREPADSVINIQISGLADTNNISSELDTFHFEVPWKTVTDTISPEIKLFYPSRKNKIFPDSVFVFRFSEPVVIHDMEGVASIFQQDSIPVHFSATLLRDQFLYLKLSEKTEYGLSYKVQIRGQLISDFRNNVCEDSLYLFKFKMVEEENLGAVSGSVNYLMNPEGELYVKAINSVEKPQSGYQVKVDSSSAFFMDKIPAGKYFLMVFEDLNKNGVYDAGRPFPYRIAEPFDIAREAVNVRARWETMGHDLHYEPNRSNED